MRLSTATIFGLTLNILTAIASPVSTIDGLESASLLEKKQYDDSLSFVACKHANWVSCKRFHYRGEYYKCFNFDQEWRDIISSVAPDPGYSCEFFTDVLCLGKSLVMKSPGYSNLAKVHNGFFNDNFFAVKCRRL